MPKSVDIKAYAKQFHGTRQEPKIAPSVEETKGLTWRDIPKRRVAIDHYNYRDIPTVVPAKPRLEASADLPVWSVKKGYVYYAGDGNGRIKIGQSANPWSRVSEMRCANPSIEILATEKSDNVYDLERKMHELFQDDHLALEWFKASDKLLAHIRAIKEQIA